MKNLLSVLVLIVLVMFVACDDDEPKIDPIVGDWVLKSFATINLPSGYTSNEGVAFEISDITFGGSQLSGYELSLQAGGIFSREIGLVGRISQSDEGTWVTNEDDLVLTPEDGDDITFAIEKFNVDDLWLAQETQFAFFHDDSIAAWFDRYGDSAGVNEYIASLTDEEFNQRFLPVVLDLVYLFER